MTRTYAVKYKSKSKMLTTPEQVAQTEEDIKKLAKQENSHVLGNDDFTPWYFAVIRFGKVRATFRHSETFNKN